MLTLARYVCRLTRSQQVIVRHYHTRYVLRLTNDVFEDGIMDSCESVSTEDSGYPFVDVGSVGRAPITVPPLSGRLMTLISSIPGV